MEISMGPKEKEFFCMKEKYILTQSTWFLVANYVPLSEIFSKKILKFIWKILPPNSHFGTLDSRCHIRSKFSVILRKVRLVVVRTYYLQSANHGDIEMLSKTSLVGRVYFSQTYLPIGFAKPLGEVSKHCLETSPRGPLVEVQCVLFDSGRLLPRSCAASFPRPSCLGRQWREEGWRKLHLHIAIWYLWKVFITLSRQAVSVVLPSPSTCLKFKSAKKGKLLKIFQIAIAIIINNNKNKKAKLLKIFQMTNVCVVLGSVREGRMGLRIARYWEYSWINRIVNWWLWSSSSSSPSPSSSTPSTSPGWSPSSWKRTEPVRHFWTPLKLELLCLLNLCTLWFVSF